MPAPDPPPLAWLAAANRATLTARLLPATVHDVSNALQVMSGAAEMLGFADNPATLSQRAGSITAQAMSAHASMQALVAFTRTTPFAAQPATDVRAACEQALALRAHTVRKLAIAVATSGGDGLRVAAQPLVLQVLLNLVINVEQVSIGREAPTLTIAVTAAGDVVTIEVADNGPGVAPEIVPRLFAWPPVPAADGALGIGLYVSRGLAEHADGTLAHVLHDGPGARFRLTLPLLRG
jgi:C4-dicarboxylate-specific signal transduction histidine kinase